MRRREQDDVDRLNEIWNARSRDGATSGAPIGKAAASHEADELVRAMARLHTRDDAPQVDHAFADELLRGLVARHPATTGSPHQRRSWIRRGRRTRHHAVPGTSHPNGWPRRSQRAATDRQAGIPWRSGLVDAVAVAAVVLLIGVSLIGNRAGLLDGRFKSEPGVQQHGTSGADVSLPAMYRGDAGRTGAMPGPGPVGSPRVMWINETDEATGETLVAANGRVFTTSSRTGERPFDLIAIDLETGEDLWRSPIDADSTSVPGVANGLVYVMAAAGLTAVYETTGEVAWSVEGGEIGFSSTPLVHEGVVYVSTSDQVMRALDGATGEPVWTVPLPGEGYPGETSDIAIADGTLFGRGSKGLVFALDTRNGDLVWETTLDGSTRDPFLVSEGIVAVTASRSDNETVLSRGFLHALDADTGEPVWEGIGLTTLATLAAADGSLFVVGAQYETGSLGAFDIRTGEPRWTWEGAGPLRSPAVVDGALYVAANGDGTVHRIDSTTGEQGWSLHIGSMSDPLVTGGLLVVMADGTVTAIAGDGEDAPVASGI